MTSCGTLFNPVSDNARENSHDFSCVPHLAGFPTAHNGALFTSLRLLPRPEAPRAEPLSLFCFYTFLGPARSMGPGYDWPAASACDT